MKTIIRTGLILIVLLAFTVTLTAQENFATDGIVEYFKIVDILKADQSPTLHDWNNFYASSGYKQLKENEFGENYFKEILMVVFKPSEKKNEAGLLQRYQDEGGFFAWYTPLVIAGFKEAENNRHEIINFIDYIKNPEALKEAEKYVAQFIPNAKIDSSFRIDFVIFSDSRGWEPIIIGITNPGKYTKGEVECLKTKGLDSMSPSILLVAHEAFHNIRNKMQAFKRPENNSDASIVNTLNKIENEGIADQINNKILYSSDGCFPQSQEANRIISEQKAQYAIINALNYFLTEIAKNPELTSSLGNAMSNMIPRSGHPTGYYMANIISSEFGIEMLKKISTNPFQFFLIYNNAAKKVSGTPTFSNEAIELIKVLEEKYLKTNL